MIAKIAEEIPQNARNRFTGSTHHGLAQTGAPPMHRLAATSDGISLPAQIKRLCSATTAENPRSTAVQIGDYTRGHSSALCHFP
jgi:hypothetical protein